MPIISQVILNSHSTRSLVPFITAGDPNLSSTQQALKALDLAGADVIELGLPYSVPLADGPTIQAASNRALIKNTNLNEILQLVKDVNHAITTPIVLFTYYNPVFNRGIFKFIQDMSRVGIQGLLIPDLPLEESDYVMFVCNHFNIELIFLIAPNSPLHRINKIVQKSFGCIYLVSKTGVTGTHSSITLSIQTLITQIKNLTGKPVILGFGISTLDQVKQVCKLNIEGIVIGSAFVKKLSTGTHKQGIDQITEFCKKIKQIMLK